MFPGVDPRQMQGMLKKMGISQEDVDASRVIIEKTDNSRIIIEKTRVSKKKAKETLEKNDGDLAETILELSE